MSQMTNILPKEYSDSVISSNASTQNELSRPQGWRAFCHPELLPPSRKKRDSPRTGKLGRSAAEPFWVLLGDVGKVRLHFFFKPSNRLPTTSKFSESKSYLTGNSFSLFINQGQSGLVLFCFECFS